MKLKKIFSLTFYMLMLLTVSIYSDHSFGISDPGEVWVNVSSFGAIGDGFADDTSSIQDAIDHALTNGMQTVYFPEGIYKISDTLRLQNPIDPDGTCSVTLFGAFNHQFIAKVRIAPTFKDKPCINIQGARGVTIKGLAFHGLNLFADEDVTWERTYIERDASQWNITGVSYGRYDPYCAISIDAFAGDPPTKYAGLEQYYSTEAAISSNVKIEEVKIQYFNAGIVINPSGTDAENASDNISITNCHIHHVANCVSIGGRSKNVVIDKTALAYAHSCITTYRHGAQHGTVPSLFGCNLGRSYKLFEFVDNTNPSEFSGIYCESFTVFGNFGTDPSTDNYPLTFNGCHFSQQLYSNYVPAEKIYSHIPLVFNGCLLNFGDENITMGGEAVVNYGKFCNILQGSNSVIFRGSCFKTKNAFAGDYTGGIYADYVDDSPSRPSISLENCYITGSTGTILGNTRWLSDIEKYYTMPDRQNISRSTRMVEVISEGKVYKVQKRQVTCAEPIESSGHSYNLTDLEWTFNVTNPDDLGVVRDNDWIFGKAMPTEIRQGVPRDSEFLVVGFVENISGSSVTVKLIYNDIDTSYHPAAVTIYVPLFANRYVSTGNFTSGSNVVTGVTNTSNFAVNDFLMPTGTIAAGTRIDSIGGSTLTLNKNAIGTAAGEEIYNCKLVD